MTHKATSITVFALAMLAVAAVAFAASPLPGMYQSTDIGGTISPGRYTEGWDAGGNALSTGTTQNCGSWNGAAIGTEWKYTCGTQIANGVVTFDNVDANGNGQRTIRCTYVGGIFWLSGTGPWANGDAEYPGHFDSYDEYETVQYFGGVPVAAVTNVQTTAHFDAYPSTCLSFSIANGSRVGTTDLGNVMPAGYPAMLATDCSATRTLGAWWTMNSLTIAITSGCVTPTVPSTWGSLKARYR